jgi:HlyD family secretion protein
MAAEPKGLFRREALERVASPERLDDLVTIVAPRDWMALGAAAVLTLAVVAWSVWGTLPTTVNGHGVIVRPRQVVAIQAASEGRVIAFTVQPGTRVEAGALIARLDRGEVEGERREQQARLAELQAQDGRKRAVEDRALALQREEIRMARVGLDLRRGRLELQVRDAQAMTPVLEERLASQRRLRAEGLIPQVADSLLDAEQKTLENRARVAELQTALKQLDIDTAELDSRQERLAQDQLEATTERRNEMDEVRARIAVLDAQLTRTGEVRAQAAGRVLELVVEPGQVVLVGGRLAMLELEQGPSELRSVLYFTTGDGKRLRPGMPTYVTPDIVPRERFGGIVGRIRSVSELPTTRESASMTLGNAEMADALVGGVPRIEVVVDLETDASTVSGYRWSSSAGPPLPISAGTIATGRVTVEGRAPITYVLPFLRSVSGVY